MMISDRAWRLLTSSLCLGLGGFPVERALSGGDGPKRPKDRLIQVLAALEMAITVVLVLALPFSVTP